MTTPFTRREAIKSAALSTGAVLAYLARPEFLFADQDASETLVPFLDVPRARPGILDWETLDAWITPQDQVFNVQHYNVPKLDPAEYRLEISGLVGNPQSLSLDDIKA